MDNKKNHGGVRENAGRKPKAEEQLLIEKLNPLEELAFKALKIGLEDNQNWAVKLFFEYKFGKPRETKDITLKEFPVIDMAEWK
jgi:hypothetical protein